MKTRQNCKKWITAGLLLIMCVVAAGVLTGCDDDDPPAAPTSADWQFTLEDGDNGVDRQFTLSMPWTHTDDIATGVLNISGYTIDITRAGGAPNATFIVSVSDTFGTSVFTSSSTVITAPADIAGLYGGTDSSVSPPNTLAPDSKAFAIQRL